MRRHSAAGAALGQSYGEYGGYPVGVDLVAVTGEVRHVGEGSGTYIACGSAVGREVAGAG